MEENSTKLSPLKQAYIALERMQTKLDEMEQTRTEPIAIIGIGCRFPGGVNDLESFWRLLCEGVDAIVEIPPDRWNKDAFYSPNPQAPGKMSSKWGGFIKDIDKFDAQFFGIAPREAVEMDPQQRMMLEVAWEALENAGQAPDRLSGSETAVFAGMATYEYSDLKMGAADLINFNNYYISGCGPNMMSGRLSYILGLQGPSVTVDTACSSSLTAIHMACQSLRLRECSMAIASGVNAILQPHLMVAYSMAGLMAKDGRCKTFDAAADGLVRGEGCGVLVLKRLSDAIAAGDNIHAVIRGSAVNQDGPSSSLSAPNGPAQTSVIREALRRGTVDPLSVGYVEAHGTGTSLGDPIEVQALGEALCKSRSKSKPLYIGSVKTNFGHLEGAAGVVGLIKTVLAVQRGKIPASLNFRTPNPLIDWNAISVAVPTELMPWPSSGQARIAGVSAFGFGGTNAHVVIEQPPERRTRYDGRSTNPTEEGIEAERPLHLFTLSAKNEHALRELASRFGSYLSDNPSDHPGDVCYTANVGRSHFEHRLATPVVSSGELIERLAAFATGSSSEQVRHGIVDDTSSSRVAFVFREVNTRCSGVGRKLYETQPIFRGALERCEEMLSPHLDIPLVALLYGKHCEEPLMDNPAYAQPALFGLQYALAELWRSWGVAPAVVMGEGIGEYVAAHVAGVVSLEDSLRLAVERGRALQALSSGKIDSGGIPAGPVDDFFNRARTIVFSEVRITLISSLLGKEVRDEVRKAEYWRDHLHLSSRLSEARAILQQQGCAAVIEIGTDSGFFDAGVDTAKKSEALLLPTLKNGEDDWQSILAALSELYVKGIEVDWRGFDGPYCRKKTILPSYPFDRRKYWTEDRKRVIFEKLAGLEENGHPVLGNRVHSPLFTDIVFENRYTENHPSFIAHHRIHRKCLMPGAGYLAQAVAASEEVLGRGPYRVERLLFHEPMIFEENEGRHVQFVLSQQEDSVATFKVFSLSDRSKMAKQGWTLHASGITHAGSGTSDKTKDIFDRTAAQSRCQQPVDLRSHFQGMQKVGAELGPCFRGIEQLWHGENSSLARLVMPDELTTESSIYMVHPVLLDAAIQVMGSVLMSRNGYSSAYLPIEVERYNVYHSAGKVLWCEAVVHGLIDENAEALEGDIALYDEHGSLSATLEGVQLKRTDPAALRRVAGRKFSDWLYELVWRQTESKKVRETSIDPRPGTWLVFTGRDKTGEGLRRLIGDRGGTCIVVAHGQSFERGKNQFTVDYKHPEHYRQMLSEVGEDPTGVVFLCTDDPSDFQGTMCLGELQDRMEEACGGVLHFIQAMVGSDRRNLPRLWIVTRGIASIEGKSQSPSVVGGSMWGLGRAIAAEHPEFSCAMVDVDFSEQGKEDRVLFDELWFPSGEDHVAFRNGERYVARLVRYEEPLKGHRENDLRVVKDAVAEPASLRGDATYLITGGLGNLGLHVARWMVQKGARHLMLLGRSGPSQEALQTIDQLNTNGASVTAVTADVAEERDVARVVGDIGKSMPPLRGVIHAAGILDDALIMNESWGHFSGVLAPKVSGAWNLHTVTAELPLDFFIMFSSTAALLPTHGQSSYGTANAFLDILAYYRRTKGLPALSINWGIWSGGGMAASVGDRQRQRWSLQGVTLMESTDALKILEQIFTQAVSQVMIIPMDWTAFVRSQKDSRTPPMLSEVIGEWNRVSKSDAHGAKRPDLRLRLDGAPANERRAILNDYVIEEVAKILKLDSPHELTHNKPLREAGLDSLMAVELRTVLGLAIGCNLPATLLFRYPTIEALTNFLATKILSIDAATETGRSALNADDAEQGLEELDALSEGEISQLLAEELSALPDDIRNG